MKKFHFAIILIIISILGINNLSAQRIILSKESQISLLTCSPGPQLYSTFGHSAIRVYDPYNRIDWIYNYGTFNFRVPNFYAKFVRGYLNYQLSVEKYQSFHDEYAAEDRAVIEQILNLDSIKKQQLFDFVEFNKLPENKYYQYDFFFDNCATRIRDVIKHIYRDSISFKEINYQITFRQMIRPYLMKTPWVRLGINLLLGMPADKKASTDAVMFLPDYLDTAFVNCKIITHDSIVPLIINTNSLLVDKQTNKTRFIDKITSPKIVFWLIFILIALIGFVEINRKKLFKGIDFIVLFINGLFACLICFMWFFTEHRTVINNLNILWTIPFNLIAAFLIFGKRYKKFLAYYFSILAGITFLVLIFWNFIPQEFDTDFIPILVILIWRYILNINSIKKWK